MNIKIGICYHQDSMIFPIIANKDIYIHMHGGREIYNGDSKFLLSLKGDNEYEENLSKYNPYINEMTVIHYLYKNMNELNADHYGLFHYRRLFQYDENDLNQYEMICPIIYFGCSVYEQTLYNHPDKQFINEFIYEFIQRNPDEKDLFVSFLNSRFFNMCNLFIMNKSKFQEYGKFIEKQILMAIELWQKNKGYNFIQERCYSFLLERMTAFFIYKQFVNQTKIKIKQMVMI